MTSASELRSGKGDRDENFPVASWIIHPRHRALILAYYNFVRTADDIADHATLPPDQKLAYLDLLEAELLGEGDTQAEAVILRRALAERGMAPRHALDVLIAFRMDVTKLRYENWDEVIHYCRYSAMPVGRFMLDVHGESTSTWAASDALCAGSRSTTTSRIAARIFASSIASICRATRWPRVAPRSSSSGLTQSPPAMLACLQALAVRNEALLDEGRSLSAEIRDFRLGVDVAVIQAYADRIVRLLKVRDPLRERVHLNKFELLTFSLAGMIGEVGRRAIGRKAISRPGTAHDA